MRHTKKKGLAWVCAAAMGISLWAGTVSGAETQPGVPVYTMKEVRDRAIVTAPDVLRQRTAIDSALISKNEAGATMDLARANAQYSEFMTDSEMDAAAERALSAIEAYNKAATGVEDERTKMENLEKQIAYEAEKLYLDILNGQVSVKAQENALASAEKDLETLKLKVKLGLAAQTEADAESQTVKNAGNQLESAKKSLADLKLSMNVYLGVNLGEPFELEDPPELRDVVYEPDASVLLEKVLNNALSLKQADRNIEDLTKKADLIVGTNQENQRDTLANQGRNAVLNREQTENSLRNSVSNAYARLAQAEKNLELNTDKLDSAQQDYAKKQIQRKLGLLSVSQLSQTESALAQNRDNCDQSRYSVYLAKRALELLAYGITV